MSNPRDGQPNGLNERNRWSTSSLFSRRGCVVQERYVLWLLLAFCFIAISLVCLVTLNYSTTPEKVAKIDEIQYAGIDSSNSLPLGSNSRPSDFVSSNSRSSDFVSLNSRPSDVVSLNSRPFHLRAPNADTIGAPVAAVQSTAADNSTGLFFNSSNHQVTNADGSSNSTIFNEPIFRAALHRPKPWLPFHPDEMKEQHEQRYNMFAECMKGETDARHCFSQIDFQFGTYLKKNDFKMKMGQRLGQDKLGQSRFPDRWRSNFDDSVLIDSETLGFEYSERVINATRHNYLAYKRYGFGSDEVRPLSLKPNNWASLAVTMVESLSTLWLIGEYDEFYEVREFDVV